jgi:hypothetical protein
MIRATIIPGYHSYSLAVKYTEHISFSERITLIHAVLPITFKVHEENMKISSEGKKALACRGALGEVTAQKEQ